MEFIPFDLDNYWCVNIRGKSMLALSVMIVVFVLTEQITLSIWEHITACRNLSL